MHEKIVWDFYIIDTGIGCGICKWSHGLPTPFLVGDAVLLFANHYEEKHRPTHQSIYPPKSIKE